MDPLEASDRIAMVDRILATADQSLRIRGTLFLFWGIAGAVLDLTIQAALTWQSALRWWWWLPVAVVYVAAIVAQVLYVRHYRRLGRLNLLEMYFVRLIGISSFVAAVGCFGGWNVFLGWPQAAIWSLCLAIPLLFVGVQGHRYALAGGVVLLASIVVASFTPQAVGLSLAVGLLIGYAGAGVAFEVQNAGHG